VNDLADAAADLQARHLGTFVTARHPAYGDVKGVAGPVRYEGARGVTRATAPPALGEHTRAVLQEAGLTEAEIGALIDSGGAR
jgi:formyl-CoA transferase